MLAQDIQPQHSIKTYITQVITHTHRHVYTHIVI